MKTIATIVLAAGKGTRMKSDLPKIFHEVGGRPVLAYVLETAALLSKNICVVLSPETAPFFNEHFSSFETVLQEEALGTGHAVQRALPWIQKQTGDVLVLCGDAPFMTPQTLMKMHDLKKQHNAPLAVLGMHVTEENHYGRIVTDAATPHFANRIVEYKDASQEERSGTLCNAGILLGDARTLEKLLPCLKNDNRAGEYYLTDLVALAHKEGEKVAVALADVAESFGINSRSDLAFAEQKMQEKWRKEALQNGVTLRDPSSVFFSYDTVLAADVKVEPFVVFGPAVKVEEGSHIHSFSHLEGVHVKKKCVIGPHARIRPGTVLHDKVKIGNFVEIKKSSLGAGAKVNHLSYVGDVYFGEKVNVGAGTITCNYNGFQKSKTVVEEGVFVGSNTCFIAPVTVGKGAIIAAGSVVTSNVPEEAIAIARAPQKNIEGGARRFKQKQKGS